MISELIIIIYWTINIINNVGSKNNWHRASHTPQQQNWLTAFKQLLYIVYNTITINNDTWIRNAFYCRARNLSNNNNIILENNN